MPIFFSPHSDLILSILSCALLLAGATCFVVSREKSLERPLFPWQFLSYALFILAAREWLGIIGLSDPTFISWYPIAAIMQTAASILVLVAACEESPVDSLRARFGRFVITLLLLALMGTLIAPYFRYYHFVQEGQALIGVTRFFLTKASMWLVSLFLLYCTARSENTPPRPVLAILAIFSFHALLIFVCRPPGLPQIPGSANPVHTYVNTTLFLARVVTAIAMAVIMWNLYSRAIGVTRKIRWWPIVLMLFVIAVSAGFVLFSKNNYRRVVHDNLAASAKTAAAAIDADALLEAASARGSANDPDVSDSVFAKARGIDYYQGYNALRIQVDALAAPTAGATHPAPVPVIDMVGHPGGGLWLKKYANETPTNTLLADHPVIMNENVDRFDPVMVTAPIKNRDDDVVGAAVLTVPTRDLALDIYLYNRPILLFLPVAFAFLLLLITGQQRDWLSAHSTSRADAIRQGVLGNELTGVMITRGDTIIDCNQRLLNIVGMTREHMLGAYTTKIFDTVSSETMAVDRLRGRETPETSAISIRRPDGNVVHLLAYGRPLTENPGDNHYIWETVDVTIQREMENRLRENHDNMQMILDTMPDGVFLKDDKGRVRLANKAFADYMGVEPDTPIIGKTIREIAPHFADVAQTRDEVCREMRGGTLVYEMSAPEDSRIKHFEVTKTLSQQAGGEVIIGTFHDLTQHMADQEALKQERHFLLQLLNTLPMSVCFIDKDETIRLCDQDFSREAGVDDPEELVGKLYSEVSPYGPVYLSEDAKMLERGHGFSDVDFEMTKNGVARNIKVRRIVMSDADGTVLGLVKAFWDTTDLVAANHAAKKAERAKAAFLTNMSHELRTPMNGIVGMADLIIDHEETRPVQRLYAETIIKSARTLQMVMDEVMDIATLDDSSRKLAFVSAPFPLLTLTEEATQIVSCIVEAWGVSLYLGYDFTLHGIHHGDARHVRQILVQMLTHCSRLTADKRIRLEVAAAGRDRVAFRTVFAPSRDLAPDEIVGLFKRPAEAVQKRANSSPSLGIFDDRIGLPLLWRLIDAMHGTLEVKNGVGAVNCEIVLPLPRDVPGMAPPLQAPPLVGMNVLAATANPQRFAAIRSCLEYARANVARSADIAGARRILETAAMEGKPFEMLALDCEIAGDGEIPEFVAELRDSEKLGNPPVMLIVTSKQVQNLTTLSDNVKTLLLPPVLPSELWYKAEAIFREGKGYISGASPASKGTTTVEVRRNSTKITRLVKVPAKVLLVEDNTVNQMVAMGILKRIGCDATLAKDGREAVDLVASGEKFDLVLMDCMMPVMDGYEATSRIRMHERTNTGAPRNTIVALTANTVTGDKEKCLASGMDGYITKPVTLDLLRDVVMKYCPSLVTVVDQAEEG